MKTKLLGGLTAVILLFISTINFAQAPTLGTAANFVLFSTVGAVGNTGFSQITGNVGTNSGAITGFGNVNGQMHAGDGVTAQCSADLQIAYNQLNATVPTFFPAPLLGNGQILNAGVYSISGATTMNLGLTLNGQGNPNAVFIFKIQGPFSTNASSKVYLINGAMACNVFWKVEGLVSMAAGTTMRGTVIANNAAINMNLGDTLEGRALSTTGAVNVYGVMAYTPIGCGSPLLTGPAAPSLGTSQCYVLFSSSGPVSNAGVTYATGDIGTNVGLTTGFNPLFVTGTIHPIPDASTAQAAADLGIAYTYLNTLATDIELLYPAQFGNDLVLTPHTYLLNAATVFTGNLYLNAQGDANAVFVIKINGALTTATYAKVLLLNGTVAKNVYWKVDGAVSLNDYTDFKGTIICNNGAMLLATGVNIDGRAMTTTGALSSAAIVATMPPGCGGTTAPAITTQPTNQTVCLGNSASFSVTATGTALSYQWRLGTVNILNGGNISGATSPTLIINPVKITDAATNYNVVVSGTFNPSIVSNIVSLTVNPLPVPVLNGLTVLCANTGSYDYSTDEGMTNYFWTVSSGGTITWGQGTSIAQVEWPVSGPQWISVSYTNTNGCTPVAPSTMNISVNPLPGNAGNIIGQTTVCAGSQGISYSTALIANAVTYVWTLPSGATIATGTGTANITVDYSANATAGNVSVYGNNLCGDGSASNLVIGVNPLPMAAGIITGPYAVCQGTTGVIYSIAILANATAYNWAVPAGATIVAGATTNTITVNFSMNAISGNITVYGTNACGTGTISPPFSVIVNPIPSAPVISSVGELLNSNAVSGNQWYFEGNPIVGATGQAYTATLSGWYWNVITLGGCSSDTSNNIFIVITGIKEPSIGRVIVYPVPNDGRFTVSINDPKMTTCSIIVYNAVGLIVFESRNINVNGITLKSIDLRSAPNGVYSVLIKSNEDKIVKRIIVDR
ncbi:MAG: ice-binding family protein [Bacteroidota bacterium]